MNKYKYIKKIKIDNCSPYGVGGSTTDPPKPSVSKGSFPCKEIQFVFQVNQWTHHNCFWATPFIVNCSFFWIVVKNGVALIISSTSGNGAKSWQCYRTHYKIYNLLGIRIYLVLYPALTSGGFFLRLHTYMHDY